jgi:hypothetical protein
MDHYQVSRFVGAVLGSGIAITIVQLFEVNGQPSLDGYRAAGIAGAALAVLTAAVAWVLPGRPGRLGSPGSMCTRNRTAGWQLPALRI